MEPEPKTKDDIKQLLKHLEDEHRKAAISDKTYKELKEKYKGQMSYMDNSVADENQQPMEEIEPEQAAAMQAAAPPPEQTAEEGEEGECKKKKGSLFGMFKKKAKVAEDSPAPPPPPPPQRVEAKDTGAMIEIEKIKTMLDAFRDQKKTTDESIQSLFESVGEVRSMSIQNDANEREVNTKLEKILDDVTNLRPKEVEKKFNTVNETLDKNQVTLEKLQAKSDDMAERLGKLGDLVKVIGNTENLMNINENVQKKLADIQEATNYVERLASKAEKIYIDLKMELEDIVIYKSKQEGMEDAMKDLLKTIDAINTKFDNYTTKKDLENERQDIMILSKETEGIKSTLAMVQANVPEPIVKLRKDREDINIFLDSLDEQHSAGRINSADYQMIKTKNMEKMKLINENLEKEWKKFERMTSQMPAAPPPTEQSSETPALTEEPAPETAPANEAVEQQPTAEPVVESPQPEQQPEEPAAEEITNEEQVGEEEIEEAKEKKPKRISGKARKEEDEKQKEELISNIKTEMEKPDEEEKAEEPIPEEKAVKKKPGKTDAKEEKKKPSKKKVSANMPF
jgi:hypothetical protein